MTNQTNEEIIERIENAERDKDSLQHVKLKHPPRRFFHPAWNDKYDVTGRNVRLNVEEIEYLSLPEHEEIVSEIKNAAFEALEQSPCVPIFSAEETKTALATKDKEIAELKATIEKYQRLTVDQEIKITQLEFGEYR